MFRDKVLPLLLAALLAPAGAARGEAELSVRVSPREVLVGDPVQLSVLLSGAEEVPAAAPVFERPDAAPLAGPSVSREMRTFNGRTVSRVGWNYTAYPAGTGVVSFGSARLDVGGRTLSAPVPDIRVVPPPEQPWVRLSLESDKAEVLVDEAFDVTLAVEILLPSAEGWRDNPIHPRAAPALTVPWLAARPADNVALRAASLSDVVSPLVAPRGGAGFTVNGLSADPFASLGGGFPAMPGFGGSLFGDGPLVFAFLRTFPERDGARFVRYALRVPMVAMAEGEARFAPVRFEGRVVADGADGPFATDPFVALSAPLVVRVVPPPLAGRPDSFCGVLAASLAAEASLDTQTCRQGDPVELSIRLSGDFVRSTAQAPDPARAEGFSDLFRAWDDPVREDLPDGSVRFRYKLRALSAGTIDVPPIPVSYFDTAARAYATVRTAPLPLRVEAVAAFDAGDAFAAATNLAAAAVAPRAVPALTFARDALDAPPPGAPPAAFLAPPALFVLALAIAALLRRRRAIAAALRRRLSRGRAAAGLRSARSPGEALEAVRRLLRERWGEDLPGLTPGDVRAALLRHGADPAAADEAARLLQEAFDEAYRPGGDALAAVRERRGRLAELFAALRRAAPLLLAAALLAAPARGRAADSRDFLWNQARAEAARAKDPADFLALARLYRSMAEDGGAGPALWFDCGVALLLAERPEAARDAFRRAEALGGASPEIGNGLALAGGPAWHRPLLFWHHAAPLAARERALAAAWALAWAAGLLLALLPRGRRRRARAAGRALLAVAVLACVLLATSVAASRRLLDAPPPDIEEAAP